MSAVSMHPLEVAGIVQETADTRSFLLTVPRALRSAFDYLAGQFLTFAVAPGGVELRRCYSLASAPETDAWLRVTVKRVAGGRVSNWLHDEVRVGDRLAATTPEGRFVLRADAGDRPLLIVGAGSGIAPLMGLLKSALAGSGRRVRLLYANRNADSVIFRDEIELLQRRYPKRFEVHHHLSGERGRLGVEEARRLIGKHAKVGFAEGAGGADVPDFADGADVPDVYVCGPQCFMDTIGAALDSAGVAPERRFIERFFSPTGPDRIGSEDVAVPSVGAAAQAHEHFRLTMDGRTKDVAWIPGQTLLAAAVAAGTPPPSSCSDGFCGCCMARIKEGEVCMPRHDALTDDDVEKGWVLACQASPVGAAPMWVDFDARY